MFRHARKLGCEAIVSKRREATSLSSLEHVSYAGLLAMKTLRAANAALVVVIDDAGTVRRTTETLLRSQGFQVVAAELFNEAMDRLSKLGRRADLIVCGAITEFVNGQRRAIARRYVKRMREITQFDDQDAVHLLAIEAGQCRHCSSSPIGSRRNVLEWGLGQGIRERAARGFPNWSRIIASHPCIGWQAESGGRNEL